KTTNFEYDSQSNLKRIVNPDKTALVNVGQNLWLKEGSTEVLQRVHSVDSNGIQHMEENGKKSTIGTEGWQRRDDGKGNATFDRVDSYGSTIVKNDKDQVIAIKDKDGKSYAFGYGSDGKLNKISYPSGETWSTKD